MRVAGIDLHKPRIQWVAEAIAALALMPHGFATSELAEQVQRIGGRPAASYTARRAAYDLKKFRGKGLVRRIDSTRRYEAVPGGLKILAAFHALRHHHVLKPLLAVAEQAAPSRGALHPTALDRHYAVRRTEMHGVFRELGIAA